MKYLSFLLFLFVPTISIAEDMTLQKYQERLATGKERLAELERHLKAELQTQCDVIKSVKESIAEQRNRLKLPTTFLGELDVLLETLGQPENLVTSEEHITLIASRSNLSSSTSLPLEKLNNVITNITEFIAFFETITACTEAFDIAIKQTVWHKHESFAQTLSVKIKGDKLKANDLKDIYIKIKNLRKKAEKLLEVSRKIKIDTSSKTDAATREKLRSSLGKIADSLSKYFDQKAAMLWGVLQRSLPIADIPDYSVMTLEALITDNPVAHCLNHASENEAFSVQMPLTTAEPVTPSATSSSFLPKPLQKLLSPSKPVVSEEKLDLKESLANDLLTAFAPPQQWVETREKFRNEIAPWLNVPFIISNLKKILEFYETSKNRYMLESQDNANPTAIFTIPGQIGLRFPQTHARKICSLAVRGTLCADLVDCDRETAQGAESDLGSFVFRRSLPSKFSHVGDQFIRYWLESLVGVPTEPLIFFTSSHVDCLTPINSENLTGDNFTQNFLSTPANWKTGKNTYFITAQRKPTGQLLRNAFQKVAMGQTSLADLVDEKSLGVHLLLSLLSRGHTPLDNYELIRDGGSDRLKRIGFTPTFPIPPFSEESGQSTTRQSNILYFLPFTKKVIPQNVKEIILSNDIYLILAGILSELTTLQTHYNSVIEQYNLAPHNQAEQPQNELNQARAIGLFIMGRKQAIHSVIQNFYALRTALTPPQPENGPPIEVTYAQALKSVWASESDYHDQLFQKTQKDTDTLQLFFEEILPGILATIRAEIKAATNLDQRSITLADLDSYSAYAKEFKVQAEKYYSSRKAILKERAEKFAQMNALSAEIKQLRTIVDGNRERVETLRKTTSPAKIIITGDNNDDSENAEIASLTRRNSTTLSEVEEKMKLHKDVMSRWKFLDEIIKSDSGKSPLACFFDNIRDLTGIRNIPQSVFDFFTRHYNAVREKGAFDIRIAMTTYHTSGLMVVPGGRAVSSSSANSNVPVSLPDHPLVDMVRDLAESTELSLAYPNLALAVMEPFLKMASHLLIPSQEYGVEIPRLLKLHRSWHDIFSKVKENYVAPPISVLKFLRNRGLSPSDEKQTLAQEQLGKFKEQETCTERVTAQLKEQAMTPAQRQMFVPGFLWRQLFFGRGINPKWEMLVAGIGDLLLLPPTSHLAVSEGVFQDPGSIGVVVGANRNGGIFTLNHITGHHTLATYSEKWSALLKKPYFLPCKLRKSILSVYMPLLNLEWLRGLKELYPNTEFEPWFMGVLIARLYTLQELLSRDLSITFKQIIASLYPELQFFLETVAGSSSNSNNNEVVAKRTIEQSTSNFDWMNEETSETGINLATLLNEWDKLYDQNAAAAPVTIDQAATEWLKRVVPTELGPELLIQVLKVAANFKIDFENNNFPHWKNASILVDLARRAPVALVELAASLRMGFQVRLNWQKNGVVESLNISGTRGTDILKELVCLYPGIQVLTLSDNRLMSLNPVIPNLRSLPYLTTLCIEDEPLHNPAPVVGLPKLTTLKLRNTGVPSMVRPDFLRLMGTLCTQSLDQFVSLDSTNTGRYAQRDQKQRDTELSEQLKFLLEVIIDEHTTQETLEEIIFTIEYIARDPFFITVLACVKGEIKDRIQNLRKLIPLLSPPYDPQLSAKKLLFAFLHGLPNGTDRNAMVLTTPPLFEVTDLLELKIAETPIMPSFLKRLSTFSNITNLFLPNVGLTDLSDFPRMLGLLVLDVSANSINSLAGLVTNEQHKRFPKLTELNVSKNQLTSRGSALELLRDLTYLISINLADNLLTEVPPFGKNSFPNLVKVDVRENNIPLDLLEKFKNTDKRFYTPQRVGEQQKS